jgi:hypothetical protein
MRSPAGAGYLRSYRDGAVGQANIATSTTVQRVTFPAGSTIPGGVVLGAAGGPSAFVGRWGGTGAPNTVSWIGVPLDPPGAIGTRVIRLTNIRANASQLGVSSTLVPSQVVAFVSITSVLPIALGNPQQIIAMVTRGATVARGASTTASLTGRFVEGFASSFRRRASLSGDLIANSDGSVGAGTLRDIPPGSSGAYDADLSPTPVAQAVPGQNLFTESSFYLGPGVLGLAGLADHGSHLMLRLSKIPAGAEIFAGLYEVGATRSNSRVRLIAADPNGAGAFNPVAPTTTAFSAPAARIPILAGVASLTYEVVGSDPWVVERIDVPIFVNGAPVGGIEVAGAFGPLSSVGTATTLPVPRFVNSITPVPVPTRVGVFQRGLWALDLNGNGRWDGTPVDTFFALGEPGDVAVMGDWNNDGKTEVGVNHRDFWVLDYNGNGRWDGPTIDRFIALGGNGGEIPVVGDWNGDGRTKVGFFWNGFWALDYNGNGQWDGENAGDRFIGLGGVPGDIPVVGDWNGDGRTKVGVFRDGVFALDYNGNGVWDGTATDQYFAWGQAGDKPMLGDWNGDGRTKVGINRHGFWLLDYNGNRLWDGIGTDRFIALGGNPGEIPMVGDWNGDGKTKVGFFWNGFWALDYNGNGQWDGENAGDRFIALGGQPNEQPVTGRW